VVVKRRPFLVLERDHLVSVRGRQAGWPGERGRGRAQRGRWQRWGNLLHLDCRAQVMRTGAAWYEVLGHDAAGIVARCPVVAHHGLLHGTPTGRLPLERWWGRRERQATIVASAATTVVTVVKRGRRQ